MPRDRKTLRPIESVILRLRDEGHSSPEIGTRIGKKPGTVDRIFEMIEHKDALPEKKTSDASGTRPIERVIHRLRGEGETYGAIGNRINKSGYQVRKIEDLSRLRP
jgi:DNA-binding CsgD family transcriptional regulator